MWWDQIIENGSSKLKQIRPDEWKQLNEWDHTDETSEWDKGLR